MITETLEAFYTPMTALYCLYNPYNTALLPAIHTIVLRAMSLALVALLLIVVWTALYR